MTVTDFVPEPEYLFEERETDAQKIMRLTVEASEHEGRMGGLKRRNRMLQHQLGKARAKLDELRDSPPQIVPRRDPLLEQARERLTAENLRLEKENRRLRNLLYPALKRRQRAVKLCLKSSYAAIGPRGEFTHGQPLRVRAVG